MACVWCMPVKAHCLLDICYHSHPTPTAPQSLLHGSLDSSLLPHLQDSPLTNAGVGSCLNLAGHVECDAGVMDGQSGTFGAVGAVTGIRNPSMAALRVMEEGRQGPLSLGRIPPMCVVGRCVCFVVGVHFTWACVMLA